MKVIKIGAPWCSGCLVMGPRWEKVEHDNPWLETEYLDFDEDTEKVKEHVVGKTLPVFVFLSKDGCEIDRKVGEITEEEILKLINKYKDK